MIVLTMTTAATAAGAGSDTAALTTVHFILIAILIVLTVIGIAYGARLKRRRAAAEEASDERVEMLEAAEADPVAGPTPAVTPQPANTAAAPPSADAPGYRLADVKGLGPKAVGLLAAQGVDDLAALAALTPERAAAVDAGLGPLSGRLTRDRWVEQARLLHANDRAGFEAVFGKL